MKVLPEPIVASPSPTAGGNPSVAEVRLPQKRMSIKRVALLFVCLTVILIRMDDAFQNPAFGPDKLTQLAGSVNLLEGHGVSLAYRDARAPAVTHYEPIVAWAPGYSWLAAVGLFLTGELYYAVVFNDLFFVLLQLASSAWLISLFPGMPSTCKMLWFCAFALNTSLVTTNSSVDTAAMGGYTLALACVLYSLQRPTGSRWAGIGVGSALTFCLLMRHAYLPQAFLFPATLALIFAIEKRCAQLKFLAALTASLLTGIAMYWLLKSGDGITPPGSLNSRGFFPMHLTRFNYSFIYEGFFSAREWRLLAAHFGPAGALQLAVLITRIAALIVGVGAMTALILGFVRGVRSWLDKGRVATGIIGDSAAFPLLLVASMGCNLLLLVWMSITNPMQTWITDGWTFVQEGRYYVPSWLSLWIAGVMSLKERHGRHLWNRTIYLLPTILLAVNVVAFGYHKNRASDHQPQYPDIVICASRGFQTLQPVDSKSIQCDVWDNVSEAPEL